LLAEIAHPVLYQSRELSLQVRISRLAAAPYSCFPLLAISLHQPTSLSAVPASKPDGCGVLCYLERTFLSAFQQLKAKPAQTGRQHSHWKGFPPAQK